MKTRNMLHDIHLTDEERRHMREEIAAYYENEREATIGLIQQNELLDMFLDRLAPVIYNKALDDARRWYTQTMDNLDADYGMLYRDLR